MYKNLYLIILLFCSYVTFTQSEQKIDITNNLFIKDALIVSRPESTPTKQSIVIRNGLITQIGAEIKPPFDCKIIKADSMYVYAGFIDAMSHTGIKKEEENKDAPKPNSKGEANYEQSGITPQIEAIDKLSIKESSIGDMRKSGFTTSHIFPKGRMLGGKSTIISLNHADHEDKMVLKNNVAQYSSLTPSNGVYPNTVIGVFAKYRDLFKNVDIYYKNKTAYELNPIGMQRPIYAVELNALIPVLKKEQPLFFITKNVKEIFRALELQKEIGFNMVLAEVKNVTPVMDKLKTSNFPILLSLDLPDEIKDEKKGEGTKEDTIKKEPIKEISAERKALEEKKKQSYNEYLTQAALLEKNNIPFSFSYIDVKTSDILKSVRRYIKSGLTEKTAIAALTTIPAKILNIAATHGTIEVGKSANLVISQKPIFDEKSSIKYVIVDGKIHEYYENKKGSESKSDKILDDLEGIWTYNGLMNGQTQSGTMEFKRKGDIYTAIIKSNEVPDQTFSADDVTINGNTVNFSFTADFGTPTEIKVEVKIDNNDMNGIIEIANIGVINITGSKKKNPDYKY